MFFGVNKVAAFSSPSPLAGEVPEHCEGDGGKATNTELAAPPPSPSFGGYFPRQGGRMIRVVPSVYNNNSLSLVGDKSIAIHIH